MKISAIFATLALTPALLHAQPFSSTSAAPADTHTSTAPLRVSTGVVAPRLIYKAGLSSNPDWHWVASGPVRTAEVLLTVDATGHATNVRISKSAGTDLDANVLASVSQYRFQPATVDSQPTPMDVDLTLDITRP